MFDSRTDTRNWLFEAFSSQLSSVFETLAGERPAMEWTPGVPPSSTHVSRWRQRFTGLQGEVWIAAGEPAWRELATLILRTAGTEETDPSTLRSTYLQALGQVLGGVARAISSQLDREVACAAAEENATIPGDAACAEMQFKFAQFSTTVVIALHPALLQALTISEPIAPALPPVTQVTLATAEAKTPAAFDLLLDVELPVTVSFGRAQVPLKDVIKLSTGSIIELNRSINEPVEVIVNNCVIARGEVVVVEGNFGVRIQQVITRQERLRTLT